MIKFFNQIQAKFNKASSSYDNVAEIQRQSAEFLVSKLFDVKDFDPKTILDLGTGTGYITELLLPKYQQSSYYLNDIAYEMLDICKAKFLKYPNVYYLPGDMMHLNISNFDLVISNLALQWINDLHSALKFFNLINSGIFTFSTLLDGTFKEWENLLNKYQNIRINNYPKEQELIDLCNKLKRDGQTFEYWLMDIPLSFNSPLAFMRYLKLLGASTSKNSMNLSSIKELLRVQQCKKLTVTYKIFFGIFKQVNL